MTPDLPNGNTQRGAALAIGLILLAVAALVTLTAMNTGIMQERMTANHDNNARSFMAAEAGGADLVSWVIANGLPTNKPDLGGAVDGDPLMTYELKLHPASNTWSEWNENHNPPRPLHVLIEGRSLAPDDTVLARTELLIEFVGDPPPSWIDAPAAISCFYGPCSITAGAGKGAEEGFGLVSGYNHPIPRLDCTGDRCRMQPQGEDRDMPAVPAVFLEDFTNSIVDFQGGNDNNNNKKKEDWPRYQGLGPDLTSTVEGNDKDSVAVEPNDYPNSTAPTWDKLFPEDPETALESGNASDEITGNQTEVGTLVIDTPNFELNMKGTSLFVGVIVIRNCGSLVMKGNPNVYGAVIVDARPLNADGTPRKAADGTFDTCSQPYDPFASNGTPAVRFVGGPGESGGGTGTGGNGLVKRWSEYLP